MNVVGECRGFPEMPDGGSTYSVTVPEKATFVSPVVHRPEICVES